MKLLLLFRCALLSRPGRLLIGRKAGQACIAAEDSFLPQAPSGAAHQFLRKIRRQDVIWRASCPSSHVLSSGGRRGEYVLPALSGFDIGRGFLWVGSMILGGYFLGRQDKISRAFTLRNRPVIVLSLLPPAISILRSQICRELEIPALLPSSANRELAMPVIGGPILDPPKAISRWLAASQQRQHRSLVRNLGQRDHLSAEKSLGKSSRRPALETGREGRMLPRDFPQAHLQNSDIHDVPKTCRQLESRPGPGNPTPEALFERLPKTCRLALLRTRPSPRQPISKPHSPSSAIFP